MTEPRKDSTSPKHNLEDTIPGVERTNFDNLELGETLDTKITAAQANILRLPEDSDEITQARYDLSDLLYTRFEEAGAQQDIEAVYELNELVLNSTLPNHPQYAQRMGALASAVESLGRLHGDSSLLDRAILLQKQAISIMPFDEINQQDRMDGLYNLSIFYGRRFQTGGNGLDLPISLDYLNQTIDLSGGLAKASADTLTQLGAVYFDLFEFNGDITQLESSVEVTSAALAVAKEEYQHRRIEAALARSLHGLFIVTGDSGHLHSCIKHMDIAVKLTPLDSVLFSDYQSFLGAFIWARYRLSRDINDLLECISLERACLEQTPVDHPLRDLRHSNLAMSLISLYEIQDEDHICDEAVALLYKSIQLASNINAVVGWKHRLSNVLLMRYERRQKDDDLRAAVLQSKEAANEASLTYPEFSVIQMRYALALVALHNCTFDTNNYKSEIMESFRRGMTSTASPPHVRVECALELTKFARDNGRFQDALEGYQVILELLPRVLWLGMNIDDRAERISSLKLSSIASDAAACSLSDGNPELAVELLEQGRSLMWSQALSLQSDISQLTKTHPLIASKFTEITSKLRLVTWDERVDDNSSSNGTAGQIQRMLVEWNALVTQIQALPGFERFLLLPSFSTLRDTAKDGSIVILNASDIRNDIILLRNDHPVVVVPLPHLEFATLEMFASDANRGRGRDLRGYVVEGESYSEQVTSERLGINTKKKRAGNSQKKDPLVCWIWENIIVPTLQPLKDINRGRNRIWLCPTGPFTFLPIHAACPLDLNKPGISDVFFVSYTPTITALMRAQANFSARSESVHMLAVGQAYSTFKGYNKLSGTTTELGVISQCLPTASLLVLKDEEATVDRIQKEVPLHSWVHFCCHGHQDENPMRSSLHMYDGPLRMSDFARMHIQGGEFAFLSACETATGARNMPDESMHLAAGLQFAGYQSIISTLWSIDDDTAPIVAEFVYKELFKADNHGRPDARNAAIALGMVIRQWKKLPGFKERLIPFVHIGL